MADWTVFATPAMLWVTVLAVSLVGLSKGGLGGAFALMGVPVMSLVMPPVLAAAVLLPILLMMDAVSLWTWRGWRDGSVLRVMLPAALIGIGLGWATAAITSDAVVRLMVGAVALAFAARALLGRWLGRAPRHIPAMGWLWGAVAGFTSFVAHAGGPPFQIQVLPKRLDPRTYTGTSVIFFAVVNAIKVVPYAALGMFQRDVLISALVLAPLAVVAVRIGAAIVRRMRAEVFYPFTYTMVALVGVKLVWDGLAAL
ncbi:MAG: sulfite exporter TauE/SafE family protein [Rhodobacter sp.]|uniref:sulfite exporter TauE/SafE family protein n=1 Tax=Pararhodobacter sp. TaxID=2127056 RepID=UPI001D2B50EF|nr:sulfite exporter TauE/SafE family protein [Pararhodobacter sp.]MCB1346900.1 sulfite exporter TauE/SafE family protein [Paracoccaceae bacterium]MCC0074135.1 sulfite exporter TauE/SafE family protein [Rhodobacter sp.]HPD92230.1 sulfite exporter TauE/SafE family protein [Pararhodobacter sp.]